jgi:hypothetical protein
MGSAVSVSPRLLEMPVEGVRLPSTTLGGVIQSAPLVWLQFLRHLGCIYCKGLVEDIRAFMGQWREEPVPFLVFVHPNTVAEGEMFFERYYPGAAHIADPVLKLYQAFRVRRARPWYFLDLGSVQRFWELLRRGHWNDRPAADPWVLHATLLFYHGNLIWTHYAKTPGDIPRWPRKV